MHDDAILILLRVMAQYVSSNGSIHHRSMCAGEEAEEFLKNKNLVGENGEFLVDPYAKEYEPSCLYNK